MTIMELMLTPTSVAVPIALAAPSLRDSALRNPLTTQGNEFIATVSLACAEAIRRHRGVTLTANNPVAANEWGNGWTVSDVVSLEQFRVVHMLPGSLTFDSPVGVNALVFAASGVFNCDALPNPILLCDHNGSGRSIDMTATGQTCQTKVGC